MSKPTFVFVPGGSHLPQVYDGVRASLSAHDYNSIAVPLPSVGGKPPIEDFTEDVAAIRDAVSALVEQEQDVIVVLHSYSGIPGGEALDESLGKNGREANGLKGGVMRLVYVTAALVPEGFQGGPKGDMSFMAPFMECDLEAGIAVTPPAAARMVFYNDLPDDVAAHWLSILQPQSLGVFWSKTSYAAWRYIPTTYVLCEKDLAFGPAITEMWVKAAKESGTHAIDVIERVDAGHFPFLSQEDWAVKMLRRAAGEIIA